MNYLYIIVLITGIAACFSVAYATKNTLKIGNKAPTFQLEDHNGKIYNLEDLKGKKVALYFYPKDKTPGCTKQACNIRDNYTELAKDNIVVLGVSKGSKKSHKKFSEKYRLPFPLLIANEKVLDDYEVNTGFLHLWMPLRRTFLINEQGIIVAIIKDININNHAQQILTTFKTSS